MSKSRSIEAVCVGKVSRYSIHCRYSSLQNPIPSDPVQAKSRNNASPTNMHAYNHQGPVISSADNRIVITLITTLHLIHRLPPLALLRITTSTCRVLRLLVVDVHNLLAPRAAALGRLGLLRNGCAPIRPVLLAAYEEGEEHARVHLRDVEPTQSARVTGSHIISRRIYR